ncbi:hypothetical protein LZ31DRAFT_593442 [Colletotrichum somersetense]|nr:hypothetical protein LZ31DRAFT_593442 [Colletotrichum somersetense]
MALGYILSAAEPPQDATFESYVVPLQPIYSRCLYLAYVTVGTSDEPSKEIATVLTVPYMTCSMYLTAGANNRLHFFLGSTYAMRYAGIAAEEDVACTAKNRLMTRFGRESILKLSLALTYDPVPTLPIPPSLEDDLVQAVWKMLLNTKLMKNYNDVDLEFNNAHGAIQAVWVEEHNSKSPPVIIPWDREKLLAKNCTQSQELRDALREVVRARWTTPYDRTSGRIRDAFLAVFGIMYFPKMYLASKSDPATPNAQKVMKLKLKGYITDRILHPTAILPAVVAPVRGIAMPVREFNNDPTLALTLAASFTKDALKTMHDNVPDLGMYREPCVDYRSLLSVFDVTVGAANYDLDAINWGIVWKQ